MYTNVFDEFFFSCFTDFRDSKMFKEAPEDIIHLLAHEDVTVNAHQFCIIDEV